MVNGSGKRGWEYFDVSREIRIEYNYEEYIVFYSEYR